MGDRGVGQRDGELVAGVDLAYPAEVLCGTLYYRWLLTLRPVDEDAPRPEDAFRREARTPDAADDDPPAGGS